MKNKKFEVPRGEFQEFFVEWLFDNGFDGYGYIEDSDNKNKTERGGFENSIFIINPYYWGDDENIMLEPNFVFKPLGLEIRWYKYPMRSAYSNMEISLDDIKEIMKSCTESMKN